jgi:hypothetical protein
MGFNNDFTIGPIRLGSLVEWRNHGDVVNLTNNYYDGTLLYGDTLVAQQRNKDFAAGKPVYLENAGFVKLRELSVGLTLPRSLSARAFGGNARDVRLEFVGRNLLTSTKYTGLDPEVSNFGNQPLGRIQDVTPYPPTRSFFFSVSTTF